MIELILVITALSILAVSAIPSNSGLAPITLDSATRKLKADIRFAQSMATTTGDSYGFKVTGQTTYQIYNVATGVVTTSPYTNIQMSEDLSKNFGKAKFTNVNQVLTFNSFGRPAVGGGILIQLSDGTSTKGVQVSQSSGYLSLL